MTRGGGAPVLPATAETSAAASLWLVKAFGARIAFAGEVESLLPAITASLHRAEIERPGATAAAPRADVVYRCTRLAGDQGLCLERDGAELARGAPEAALASALAKLHFDVAVHAREATFIHASVVRWQGKLLLFPGRSGAGKSTLAAFLSERGGIYYSDEYAPVDDLGLIHPYPRPISLRPDVRRRFAESFPGTADAGAVPAPADAIVFTRFRAAGRFRPRPLSVAAAALSLIDNAVGATPRPRQTASAVARLLAHRPRLGEGPRGELEDFAGALDRWLAVE